jgi:hypothetical protein
MMVFGQPVRGRSCAACKLCCTLVPAELDDGWTKAGERCKHLRSTGCGIYAKRPMPCRVWSCRWLTDADTFGLRRPDLTHYVIDAMPDEIRLTDNETGEERKIGVMQVWVDPAFRDAWRDPALLAYIDHVAEKYGLATILRFSSYDALTLFPPSMSSDGEWHEKGGTVSTDIGFYALHPEDGRPPL